MKSRWMLGVACALAGGAALFAPVAGRAAEQVAELVTEHTVRAGDNLHLIAGYYYRDPRQWQRIWKANGKFRGPNRLVPGRTLRVPLEPGGGWEIPYEEFRARVRGK